MVGQRTSKRVNRALVHNLLTRIRWLAMAIGETVYVNSVREQLLAGRARLSDVLGENGSEQMLRLLEEVDSALDRIDQGTFGVCEICQGTVDEEVIHEN